MRNKEGIKDLLFTLTIIIYFSISSIFAVPSHDLLRWLILILLLTVSIILGIRSEKKIVVINIFFLLLLTPMFFSLIWLDSNVKVYSLSRTISFLIMLLALFTYFSSKDYDELLKKWIYFAFTVNIFSVCSLIVLLQNPSEIGGFSGIYNNKNFLAGITGSSLILSISLLNKSKFLAITLFMINSFILIATGSRVGFIILVMVLSYYLIKLFIQKIKEKKIISLFIYFSIFILIIKNIDIFEIPGLVRLFNLDGSNSVSNGFLRTNLWDSSLSIISEKPFIGWGYGSTGYYTFINNLTPYPNWGIHNSYLVMIMDIGFIGFLLFLVFYFMFLFKSFNIIRYNKKMGNSNYLIFTILLTNLVGLVNAGSESFLFSIGNPMAFPFWVSLVLMFELNRKIKNTNIIK